MFVKVDDQDVDDGPSYVEVSGIGRSGEEWYIFLGGDLTPRWVGTLVHDDENCMQFSDLDYSVVKR